MTIVDAGKDYYKILDVPRDAPKSQIKKHYKKLSRVYHPDKNRDNKQAEAKFMEISDGKRLYIEKKDAWAGIIDVTNTCLFVK